MSGAHDPANRFVNRFKCKTGCSRLRVLWWSCRWCHCGATRPRRFLGSSRKAQCGRRKGDRPGHSVSETASCYALMKGVQCTRYFVSYFVIARSCRYFIYYFICLRWERFLQFDDECGVLKLLLQRNISESELSPSRASSWSLELCLLFLLVFFLLVVSPIE